MIIYYNKQTGEINSAIDNKKFAADSTDPYIETENNIRISDWRVDPETKQLVAVAPVAPVSRSSAPIL